ncbi:MAG: YIP1 family protein [Paracoccaceae bacterium]
MGIVADIGQSWLHPRQVMARLLADGQREDRVLMFLMVACLLVFISRLPALALAAQLDPTMPLNLRLVGALFGWLFIVPPAFYVIAALSRIVARIAGGRGSWYSARLALFWSLLAATPFWILNGFAAGYGGAGLAQQVIGAFALVLFIIIWASSFYQAEYGQVEK